MLTADQLAQLNELANADLTDEEAAKEASRAEAQQLALRSRTFAPGSPYAVVGSHVPIGGIRRHRDYVRESSTRCGRAPKSRFKKRVKKSR